MVESQELAWETFAQVHGGYFVPGGKKHSPKIYLPTGQWLVQFQVTTLPETRATAVFVNKSGFHAIVRKMGFLESVGQRFLQGVMPPEETTGILLTAQFALECTDETVGRNLLKNEGLLEKITAHKLELTPAKPQGLSEIQYNQYGVMTDYVTLLSITNTMRDLLDTLHDLGIAYPL